MPENTPDDRSQALSLFCAGRLDAARAAYEGLLSAAPDDADLLGRLGMLELQQQRHEKAETWLRRSLEPGADPRIHLRNLINFMVMLARTGRNAEAREMVAAEVPDWPEGVPADASERGTILHLAKALFGYGQPGKARRLLDRALPERSGDAAALTLDGRLRLDEGDAAGAVEILARAADLAPDDYRPLIAMSYAQDQLGRRDAARTTARRIVRRGAVYSAPPRPSQRATILVLNPAPENVRYPNSDLHELHFTKNFIAQASRMMAGEFRFASVFADLPGAAPKLPEADLVFNNLAGGERLGQPGRLEQAVKMVERIGRPVINHPEAVFQMTRQKAAALLQNIPGLRVPRIARYWRDLSRFDEIAADIAAKFTYPVIVRHVAADSSPKLHKSGNETAIRVADANELRCFLERISWPQFYVIQYVDLRKADGNYRKVRASFVGGEIIMSRCQFHDEWMVGAVAGAEFYGRFPDRAADMQRILRDPEAMLGSQLMPALEAIRDAVPLDLFALDFDVDDDGRVVLFEVQSAMILIPTSDSPDYAIAPKEPGERILEAFRRLVRAKINTSA